VGGKFHAPAALPPWKTRYPLYRRLGRTQGRSGRVGKISPSPGFGPTEGPARSESLYGLSYRGPQLYFREDNSFSRISPASYRTQRRAATLPCFKEVRYVHRDTIWFILQMFKYCRGHLMPRYCTNFLLRTHLLTSYVLWKLGPRFLGKIIIWVPVIERAFIITAVWFINQSVKFQKD